ncbi:MAG: hypothetical protein V7L21_10965 [Nostoc sp.]|uniref:hypothetical protein n=1 Tax=Nostoc sp. TaxID=1180 RepID=UPI002FF5421A|nr:hypothetical protein [Nostoc sp. NMS9]
MYFTKVLSYELIVISFPYSPLPFIVSLFADGNNNAPVGDWHNCFYLSYDEVA